MRFCLELILSVSLTGTIPLCLYCLLKKWADKKVSAAFQYNIFKALLLCFLIPFPLIKSMIVSSIFPKDSFIVNEYIDLNDRIIQTQNGYSLYLHGNFHLLFFAVWFTVLGTILLLHAYRYFRFRHNIWDLLVPDTKHQEEFLHLQQQMNLRQSVSLLYCDASVSPFTCGILRPCVVITSAVPEHAISAALRHELQHIKSHDFLFRAAAFLVILLHCWNPFIYLLWKEFRNIQELACDEIITSHFSPEEVRQYGHFLIDIAAYTQPLFCPATQFASNNKTAIHRRITKLGRRFYKKSFFAGILLFFACLIGFSGSVYACSPDVLYLGRTFTKDEVADTDWIYIEYGDAAICPEDELQFKYCDQYLLLEDGSLLTSSDPEAKIKSTRTSCSHIWKKATLKRHKQNGKGGCKVLIYDTSICTKCHSKKAAVLIGETQYKKCPHKT